VGALLAGLGDDSGADAERARRLAEVRASHPGERVIAFAESAETVRALYGLLRGTPGVAVLDGRGARVAGGPLGRAEALARFAPRAHGRPEPPAGERIELLLATDLLSEGVNLQDASVLVHLDRPWTPARLEQRMGRLTRPGAARASITVYALAPPAPAEELLQVERRLREKVRAAARAVGVAGMILPAVGVDETTPGDAPPQLAEEVRDALRRWRAGGGEAPRPAGGRCVGAVVVAPTAGLLALVDGAGGPTLVASFGDPPGAPSADPRVVARAVGLAGGRDAPGDAGALAAPAQVVADWCARHAVAADLDGPPLLAPGRRDAWRRLATAAARLPREQRPRLGPLLAGARSAVAGRFGAGAERVLAALVAAPLGDEAWLRAVAAFGAAHRSAAANAGAAEAPRLAALLVLRP
jgi:hypothetical protein